MIKERKPLSLAEVKETLDETKETEKTKAIKAFIKTFVKITPEKAKDLKEEITKMEIIKLKEKDISKIIDLLPQDISELNKIFTDVSLDADESNKILDAVKKHK